MRLALAISPDLPVMRPQQNGPAWLPPRRVAASPGSRGSPASQGPLTARRLDGCQMGECVGALEPQRELLGAPGLPAPRSIAQSRPVALTLSFLSKDLETCALGSSLVWDSGRHQRGVSGKKGGVHSLPRSGSAGTPPESEGAGCGAGREGSFKLQQPQVGRKATCPAHQLLPLFTLGYHPL